MNKCEKEQIRQLMAEMQLYVDKANQVLRQLQALTDEVEEAEITSTDASSANAPNSTTIGGICWPYRSAEILRRLGLTEIDQITNYFKQSQMPKCLATWRDKTLMEWAVITSILRKHNLFETTGWCMLDGVKYWCLSKRAENVLTMNGIYDGYDFMSLCADGVRECESNLLMLRGCGKKVCEEIMAKIPEVDFILDDNLCYITDTSPVVALDFGRCIWYGRHMTTVHRKLSEYNIATVGELREACRVWEYADETKRISKDLYTAALIQLEKHGISC